MNADELNAPRPGHDPVNSPSHYNSHPSGVETAAVTEHMSAMLGSAIKYIWRRGLKGDAILDLEKAIWCLKRESNRIRSIKDARLWDNLMWSSYSTKVADVDNTVLGDCLRFLGNAPASGADPNVCDRLVIACYEEIETLRKVV